MARIGDLAWNEWSAVWQVGSPGGGALAAHLRSTADRQTMVMRAGVAAEIVVTLVTLGVVWWVVAAERGASLIGWAVAAGLHTMVVWGFTLWNRVGIWKPLGQCTVDYLRLTRERLHRQQRSATFTLWLVGVEAAALGGWFLLERRTDLSWSWSWVPAVVVTSSAIVWAIGTRRRVVRDLTQLSRVEAALTGEGLP